MQELIYEIFDIKRNHISGSSYYLYLIKNNKLYYDWPWGIYRLNEKKKDLLEIQGKHMLLFSMIIRIISNINNVMFFFGGEQSSLNSDIILPLFSFAPKIGNFLHFMICILMMLLLLLLLLLLLIVIVLLLAFLLYRLIVVVMMVVQFPYLR